MPQLCIRIRLISAVSLLVLVSSVANLQAQEQYNPMAGGDAGFVNYQITPLPPVMEMEVAEEMPPGAGPELAAASEPSAQPEEVVPLETAEGAEGAEAAPADAESKPENTESELEIPVEDQSWWYLWQMWDVGYELGVNGSVGNSNTHTWRSAVRAKRKTEFSVISGSVDYKKSMQESTTIADRLYSEWRAEFPFPENKWSLYVHGTVEFDAFRAYDARVADDGGVGYQWYKTDVGSFITRAGAGASREFGGPSDEWVPEGVFGAVYERQLTKKQKLSFSSEFFFDWTNVGENRLNSKADWEVVIDEEANLSLKVSIIDRYDSTPNGKKPNDLDYSTVLLWSF